MAIAFRTHCRTADDCTFKTEMPDEVCTRNGLIEYLHSIDARILTTDQIEAICRKLWDWRLEPSLRTRQQHIAERRRRHW